MIGEYTGKTKYRIEKRLFKSDLVVLQVEVSWGNGPEDYDGLPTYLSGRGWRDAIPEDLQYFTE